jgi:hypothetical protein
VPGRCRWRQPSATRRHRLIHRRAAERLRGELVRLRGTYGSMNRSLEATSLSSDRAKLCMMSIDRPLVLAHRDAVQSHRDVPRCRRRRPWRRRSRAQGYGYCVGIERKQAGGLREQPVINGPRLGSGHPLRAFDLQGERVERAMPRTNRAWVRELRKDLPSQRDGVRSRCLVLSRRRNGSRDRREHEGVFAAPGRTDRTRAGGQRATTGVDWNRSSFLSRRTHLHRSLTPVGRPAAGGRRRCSASGR